MLSFYVVSWQTFIWGCEQHKWAMKQDGEGVIKTDVGGAMGVRGWVKELMQTGVVQLAGNSV